MTDLLLCRVFCLGSAMNATFFCWFASSCLGSVFGDSEFLVTQMIAIFHFPFAFLNLLVFLGFGRFSFWFLFLRILRLAFGHRC